MKRLLLAAILALAAGPSWATTYFVAAATGSDANACTAWNTACATVAGALGKATPTIIAVDAAGTFTAGAAITWTLPATDISIISSTNGGTGTTIAPSVGAVEAVGASSSAFTITTVSGTKGYIYGMKVATTTNAAANTIAIAGNVNSVLYFNSTTFELPGASATQTLALSVVGYIQFLDCTFLVSGSRAGSVLSSINSALEFINPTITTSGATKPTSIINISAVTNAPRIVVRDGDISSFSTAASGLVLVTNFGLGEILFKNLKTSSTPAITIGTWPTVSTGAITLRNVDSGNTLYKFERHMPQCDLTIDASNYLTAATQFNSAPYAWKVITTANASMTNPCRLPLIEQWNTNTGSQTLNVEFAQNSSATALTNQEIWSGQDYANSASFPSYSVGTNRNAAPITGTPADQTTSAAAWTGLTTPTTQKLANTFTAAAVGTIQAQAYVGKASTTLWINPGLTP